MRTRLAILVLMVMAFAAFACSTDGANEATAAVTVANRLKTEPIMVTSGGQVP